MIPEPRLDPAFRRVVLIVLLANFACFFVEFGVARSIGSVSLFADSVDFLEDSAINLLILVALRWSARERARVGMALAGLILIPGLSCLWVAGQKFFHPAVPDPHLLSLTGFGALVVNVGCAFLLTRYRHHSGSLTRAAFLSARNDAFANLAILAAGFLTLWRPSAWPDLIVGLGIIAINADAAHAVWLAARGEYHTAS